MKNKNPYPKGSLSYIIWDRNNNTKCSEFWASLLLRPISKHDVKLLKEADQSNG